MRFNTFIKLSIYVILICFYISITSCNDNRTFDKFHSIDNTGWNHNAPVTFLIDRQWEGVYLLDLALRVSHNYKYKYLSLILEKDIINVEKHTTKTINDTINIPIIDNKGKLLGKQSISNSIIKQSIATLKLKRNDSLKITVRHIMKVDNLQGINDIGLKLSKI